MPEMYRLHRPLHSWGLQGCQASATQLQLPHACEALRMPVMCKQHCTAAAADLPLAVLSQLPVWSAMHPGIPLLAELDEKKCCSIQLHIANLQCKLLQQNLWGLIGANDS